MRRGALWVSGAASVALVAWLYLPALHCPARCFVDPIAMRGGGLGHLELPDLQLNAWILAWVQHALLHDPAGLFDANVFHPAPAALTQSEHMLGVALWMLPLRLISSEAVWLHQVAIIGSGLLIALASGALVRWLTGSAVAGFAAGASALFMPWRFTELAHVQLMQAQWFPLVWWLLARVVQAPGRRRDTLLLAAVLTLALLSSFYLAYFLLLSCAGLLIGLWWVERPPPAAWRQLGAAALAPGAALVAVAVPYLRWSRAQGFGETRALFDSVSPADLLALVGPSIPLGLRSLPLETSYAVPLAVALLVLVAWLAAWHARTQRDVMSRRQRAFAIGLTLACVGAAVLALGRRLALGDVDIPLPGSLAAAVVPGFENLRNPLRFAIVIGVAAPVLAGLGFARLEALASSAGARAAVRAGLLGLLALNLITPPLPARDAWEGDADRLALYRALAQLPAGPLLEIPWPLQIEHDAIHAGRAMLGSTLHWKPLLNGHSGYAPRSYPFLRQVAQELPSAEGLARLEALVAVRYLLVHRGELTPSERLAWQRAESAAPLRSLLVRGEHALYEVEGWEQAGRYRAELASAEPRDVTLAGLSRAPLAKEEQRGSITLAVDGPFHFAGQRRLARPVTLALRNDATRSWPGLDPDPEGLVRLRAHFVDERGERVSEDVYPLVADVPPGTSTLQVPIAAPARAGRHRLRVELVQRIGGEERPLEIAPFELPVEVRGTP